MAKPLKTIRHTVAVIFSEDSVPVSSRVMKWEDAARGENSRRAHRVEYARPGVGSIGSLYLIDLEIECRGANQHDFTKFVRTYLPEADLHFITE